MELKSIVVVGSCMIDFTSYCPRLPNEGETIHGTEFKTAFGGKGGNQCVAAAKLGGNTTFIARFSSQVISTAVLNSEKSKIYIRKLIPAALASIIRRRINFNRNNFKSCMYKHVTFYNFQNRIYAAHLKELCQYIEGALDAFNKNYLRELYLIIVDNNSHQILESYRFRFKYNARSLNTRQSKESLRKYTLELLHSIENLPTCSEVIHDKTEVFPQICLTYYNTAPLNYHPPAFRQLNSSENILESILHMSSKQRELGTLNTGSHKVKCRCKFTDAPHDEPSLNSPIIGENGDLIMEGTDQLNEDKPNNELTITCLCSTRSQFTNVLLIECSICLNYEHVPCVGYLYVKDIPKPYVCEKCMCDNSISSTPADVFRRIGMCLYRLCLTYMFLNTKFPNDILKEVDENQKSLIIKKLSLLKLIIKTPEGYSVDFNRIDKLKRLLKKSLICNTDSDISSYTETSSFDEGPLKKFKTF